MRQAGLSGSLKGMGMISYESDEMAVARVLSALPDGEIIDHGTARTIASWFNSPGDAATFVTTGAMPERDADPDADRPDVVLMHAFMGGVDQRTRDENTDALLALDYYLEDRGNGADFGRVSGWSGMWVPKHVDYPHHDGMLATCWCYGDGSDTIAAEAAMQDNGGAE